MSKKTFDILHMILIITFIFIYICLVIFSSRFSTYFISKEEENKLLNALEIYDIPKSIKLLTVKREYQFVGSEKVYKIEFSISKEDYEKYNFDYEEKTASSEIILNHKYKTTVEGSSEIICTHNIMYYPSENAFAKIIISDIVMKSNGTVKNVFFIIILLTYIISINMLKILVKKDSTD